MLNVFKAGFQENSEVFRVLAKEVNTFRNMYFGMTLRKYSDVCFV
jgi:hypothetical protein